MTELIKFDAEKYDGVNFHVAKIPVPDPKAAEVFGESVQVVVGIGPSRLYIGVGKDPVDAIKKAIDASKASPARRSILSTWSFRPRPSPSSSPR